MKTIIFKLTPKQSNIFLDNTRYRVVVSGRKFGKTTLSLAELLKAAQQGHKNCVFISPTYRMSKNTMWLDHINKFVPPEMIKDKNETELRLTLFNGNTITLFGSDNPDRLRGLNINFAVLDEFADIKSSTWETIIEPNLLSTQGRALFTGTPKGKNNSFYHLYNLGLTDKNYKSWNYSSFDNPLIDKSLLENVQARLKAQGKDDVWQQEYMAKFTSLAGVIYKNWDRAIHIKHTDIPEDVTFALSVDRGIENPSSAGFYFIYQLHGDERIHRYDEIYSSNLSPSDLITRIKTKMGGRDFVYKFCDPSAKDFISYAVEQGLNIQPAVKQGTDWVSFGISKCQEYLAKSPIDGLPKFTVSPNCKNFIEEVESYIWEEEPENDINSKEKPRKLNDHALDEWRYLLVSYKESQTNFDDAEWALLQEAERKSFNW